MNGADMMIGDPSGSKGQRGKQFQHPTYAHLIHDAISSLRQRGGSSATAIRKSIEQKMGPVLGPNYKKIVGSTLSKLAKTGKLIKTGNTFKLSPEFKQEHLRRRRRGRHAHRRRRRRRRSRRGRRKRRRRRRRKHGKKGRRRRRSKHRRRRRRRRSRSHHRRGRKRSHSPHRHRRRRRRHHHRSRGHAASGEKRVRRRASNVPTQLAARSTVNSENNSEGNLSP